MPGNLTPDERVLLLWYELGHLYAEAGEEKRRAWMLGFVVVFATGALVLLSAPLFGTMWVGPFAPTIPIMAGLLAGGGLFALRRARFLTKRNALREALAGDGLDADRPARGDLSAYYDAQLILLRSEYEFLRLRGADRTARLFEQSFGFTPEDAFETGPLNVAPDTKRMRLLREKWEARLVARRAFGEPPALGLREDLAYRVFPREMTVPMELATRSAYLTISRAFLFERYGKGARLIPEGLRLRAERDLGEYRAIARR